MRSIVRFFRAAIAALFVVAPAASALIMVGGKEPVKDHNWPAGSLDVANDKGRLSYAEGPPFGGGQYMFYYRGDTATLNDVLSKFAQIKAPELLVIVHDGAGHSPFIRGERGKAKPDDSFDWMFTVWTPENYYHLFGNPASTFSADQPQYRTELPPPQLDVYLTEGRVDWERVQVPAGVRVEDERATSHGYKAEDGSVIIGAAYDMITSKPVAGVEVSVERHVSQAPQAQPDLPKKPQGPEWEQVASAVGDADGRFELKKIPAGSYQAVARCAGYAPRGLGWVTLGDTTLKRYVVRMSPAVELNGQVVDGAGKPLSNVKVRVDQTIGPDGRGYPRADGHETTTDAEGKFTFPGLPRGQGQITAWAEGHYQVDMLKVHKIPAEGGVLTLKMTRSGAIRGRVVDGNGKPLSNGNISIWPEGGNKVGTWGAGANLKGDGSFAFENVPTGKYYVSADPGTQFRKDGGRGVAKLIEVKPGETADVEVTK